MIKDLFATLELYRGKFALTTLVLTIPVTLALYWTPVWVAVVCVLLAPVLGAALVLYVFIPNLEMRRDGDDPNISDAQIRKMRKMSSGIQNLLSRWSQVSSHSHASIEQVYHNLDEVISHSESAVIQISNNFIDVTRKTRKQVEYALGLLERTRGSNAEKGNQSLPQLIAAYESMLQQVTASLTGIAETAQKLEQRHEAVRENLKHIDASLDQLSAHDSQIGMIALNTSVSGAGGAGLVSMSDQIRTLSLESKALTRDIRRNLEEVKTQAQEIYGAVRVAAKQARDASQFAGAEVGKLTEGIRATSHEVGEALALISGLGSEIQNDINNIIVALQFQDLTQQKLQRLKNPLLTDLTVSLRAISDETRAMSGKLQGRGMVDTPAPATPFRVSLSGEKTDIPETTPSEQKASPTSKGDGEDRKPKGSESVELF